MFTALKRGAFAGTVLVVLAVAVSCTTQATTSPTPTAIDRSQTTIGLINARPTGYIGRTVSVMGTVRAVYSPRIILVSDPTDEEMLVMVSADSPVPNVAVSDKVETSGVVSTFGSNMSPTTGVQTGGAGQMSSDFYDYWRDRPVIVAVRVAKVGVAPRARMGL